MTQETRFGAHIGTSSLLLIFLTLSLVSFGALSLAGAKADQRLSDKLYEHTLSYYAAQHEAEQFIAVTNSKLKKAYEASGDENAYRAAVAGMKTEDAFPVGNSQELVVKLAIEYPDSADEDLFSIRSWRIKSISDDDYTRHLPVSDSGDAHTDE
ncbi:MAG: hypothetical protein K6C95_01835 [Lachnospiraceae bacterium]|nr:hypothetical protein [Lachnospiraceae bacterium]